MAEETGKLWGPGFMRQGSWTEEPTLSQPFNFICENGDIIRTQNVRQIIADASGYTFVDWWDRDFFVERTSK